VRATRPWLEPRTFAWVLALCTAVTFGVGLFRFDGPARGYWDTYITAPAMFMNQVPVRFVLKDGAPAFKAELEGELPHDLVDTADYGIITKDQRLGPGIAASAPFAFFGQFGFRVLFALAWALVVPLGVWVARAGLQDSPGRDVSGLVAGLVMAWNPFSLTVDRLNANAFAMPLMAVVLALLLSFRHEVRSPAGLKRGPRVVALGLAFGLLATIREEAVCFVPTIAAAMLWPARAGEGGRPAFGRRLLDLVLVGGLTVLVMAPIFHFKQFAFGDPFLHPSQYSHYEGFRPTFPHRVIGDFNGLFNWPFHTALVRTPHFGFPTYFLFPLVTLRALGLGLGALALTGAVSLWRSDRRTLALCVLWSLPVYVLFGPQENWEEVKMTFMLLAWPPIGVLLSAGITAFQRPAAGAPERGRGRTLVTFAVSVALLFALVKGLGAVEVPADDRWYVRFPNANAATNPDVQVGLAVSERNDWVYFQSVETEGEVARERRKLSAAWPWPAEYLPLGWDFGRELTEMATELDHKDLTVLEIWGYIYGTRR
jgi:hypothetical protein